MTSVPVCPDCQSHTQVWLVKRLWGQDGPYEAFRCHRWGCDNSRDLFLPAKAPSSLERGLPDDGRAPSSLRKAIRRAIDTAMLDDAGPAQIEDAVMAVPQVAGASGMLEVLKDSLNGMDIDLAAPNGDRCEGLLLTYEFVSRIRDTIAKAEEQYPSDSGEVPPSYVRVMTELTQWYKQTCADARADTLLAEARQILTRAGVSV